MKNQFKRILAISTGMVFMTGLGVTKSVQGQNKPSWELHLDWAARDESQPACSTIYLDLPPCFMEGNRACVIRLASELAKKNDPEDDEKAFALVFIAFCDNVEAQEGLREAGPQRVADYLREPGGPL